MKNKIVLHLPTGTKYEVYTDKSLNTLIQSHINDFNQSIDKNGERLIPEKNTLSYQIIKDYICLFNENSKPTKSMWIWTNK